MMSGQSAVFVVDSSDDDADADAESTVMETPASAAVSIPKTAAPPPTSKPPTKAKVACGCGCGAQFRSRACASLRCCDQLFSRQCLLRHAASAIGTPPPPPRPPFCPRGPASRSNADLADRGELVAPPLTVAGVRYCSSGRCARMSAVQSVVPLGRDFAAGRYGAHGGAGGRARLGAARAAEEGRYISFLAVSVFWLVQLALFGCRR